MLKRFISSFLILAISSYYFNVALAQQDDGTSATLSQQYNGIIENSETYNEYRVIKIEELNSFKKIISDSIKSINNNKKEAYQKIKTQKAIIESLNISLAEKDELINSSEEEKSSITVLGINLNKRSYSIVSLIAPLLLIIVIIGLFIRLKSNNMITQEAKSSLLTVDNEFENYKKKALENQMKLKRELQTERNKLLEIKK